MLQKVRTSKNDVPVVPVVVSACGQLNEAEAEGAGRTGSEGAGKTGSGGSSSSSSSSSGSGSGSSSSSSSSSSSGVRKSKANPYLSQRDDDVEEEEEEVKRPSSAAAAAADPEPVSASAEQIAAQTAGMSDAQRRLFMLRLQINKGRQANKAELEHEFRRSKVRVRGRGSVMGCRWKLAHPTVAFTMLSLSLP